MNIIWMSRHSMTDLQLQELRTLTHIQGEVINLAPVFPANSTDAVEQIHQLAGVMMHKNIKCIVAGVFPAHIAGALARRLPAPWWPRVYVPVAIPAPALEGETRGGGFIHSHWEEL